MKSLNNSSKYSASPRELLDFLLRFSKYYLASGGPTSRLEDLLTKAGAHFGKTTEVFATPTGVFITICGSEDAAPQTSLTRIKETGTNLGWLCALEETQVKLISGDLTLAEASNAIDRLDKTTIQYSVWFLVLVAFISGFAISFEAYQRVLSATISGSISASVWLLGKQVVRKILMNPVFTDFFSAFLILLLAAIAHIHVAPLSIESYALGGIVMLVPGLALTTAIAELADQNLVSGTAKFMQGVLLLLSLGLAYLLFQQLSISLGFRQFMLPAAHKTPQVWISALTVLVNVSCYGVIFRVPPKSIPFTTLTGILGWCAVSGLSDSVVQEAAPFLGALSVGLVALSLGKFLRLPSQVFSVPGIVAMLPGMLALKSFRYFATGDQETGLDFGFQVAVTAVSIVFGLMLARVPFALGSYLKNWRKKQLNPTATTP